MPIVDERILGAARAGDHEAFAALIAPFRRELRAHCYRLTGSLVDADDLLQESLLRAWKGLARFEGRSSLRTWLYRVTTNSCLDVLDRRKTKVLPEQLGPAVSPDQLAAPDPDLPWLEPCPEGMYVDLPASPEARYSSRESVTLAFLVALQALPARQRAVLILRDVVGWEAAECAELLDMSVFAVNSALQRARDTMAARAARNAPVDDAVPPALLARYVDAWQLADVGALVALLRDDATLAMPPMPTWLAGADAIGASLAAMVLPPAAAGRYCLVPIVTSGRPGFAAYAVGSDGMYHPSSIHVVDVRDGAIAAIHAFLDVRLFPRFGLPDVPLTSIP
jgi:RNA polymerase sigma-70 factor (ECF subfamily)